MASTSTVSENTEENLKIHNISSKISCIRIDPKKSTKIDIHGGINAIGDGAKVIVTQASVEGPESIWWMVQKPVASFTGRSSELERLHEKVIKGGLQRQTLIADKVSAVTGLGGIGKSELARMYAHVKGTTDFDGNVIWINAEDTVSMTSSFSGLAEYLGIEIRDYSGKRKDITAIVKRVYDYFRNRKSLFIFDNAEFLAMTRPFLPVLSPECEPPYILLTSRNQNWGENVTKLELDMLSKDEAIELICKCLKDQDQYEVKRDDAQSLADTLHCFPLALQQAVAYIKKYNRRRRFTINDYLLAFEKKTKEMLSFPLSNDSDYVKTVYITWQVTFDKLKSEGNSKLVIDILGMIAYMHADDIPYSTFLKLANNEEDELWDALELLEQFSLIKRSESTKSQGGSDAEAMYSIHRLVQTVLRLQLGPDKEDGYLSKALVQMEKFVKGRYGNYDSDRKFIYHAMMIMEHGSKDRDLLERFCYLPVRIVDALLYQGWYQEALDYVTTQRDLMLKSLGEMHHSTLALQFNIARSLHCIGKHNDALLVYQKAAEHLSRSLGPLHCDTLAARIDLAFLYIDLKQPKMSLELFEDIYDKKTLAEKVYDEESSIKLYQYRDIFTVLYGIAHSLQLLKRYGDAENYYRIVYDKRRISDGENHARTLHAGNKIAEALMQQKKYEEAISMLNMVYSKQKDVIGENHPHTLVTEGNIVKALEEQNKKDEALNMLLELYERKVAALGQNNSIVLKLKQNIDRLCSNASV